jgi:hypothetical protein
MTLITDKDKTVPVTVQTRTAIPPNRAFDIIVPIDLSLVFKGWGPFPAVRGVKNQTEAWDHAGPSRNPDLSDGSTATERLTEYTAGHSFAYELTEFTNVLRRHVRSTRALSGSLLATLIPADATCHGARAGPRAGDARTERACRRMVFRRGGRASLATMRRIRTLEPEVARKEKALAEAVDIVLQLIDTRRVFRCQAEERSLRPAAGSPSRRLDIVHGIAGFSPVQLVQPTCRGRSGAAPEPTEIAGRFAQLFLPPAHTTRSPGSSRYPTPK